MGIRHVLGVNLTVQFTALHAVKNSRYTEVKSKSAKKKKTDIQKTMNVSKKCAVCVYMYNACCGKLNCNVEL